MADDYVVNGNTFAADEIASRKFVLFKPMFGSHGVANYVDTTTPFPTRVMPYASGGLSRHHKKAAGSTNATSVKATAGQVYKIHAFNAAGATKYLKLYDKASAPTVGTDTPVEVYPLAAGVQTAIAWEGIGMPFSLGIAYALTGGVADADTTALSANDVILNMGYL